MEWPSCSPDRRHREAEPSSLTVQVRFAHPISGRTIASDPRQLSAADSMSTCPGHTICQPSTVRACQSRSPRKDSWTRWLYSQPCMHQVAGRSACVPLPFFGRSQTATTGPAFWRFCRRHHTSLAQETLLFGYCSLAFSSNRRNCKRMLT